MGKIVDAFNQANPNIKVTMTTQRDYYIKLGTAQAADQLPDVAIVHADQLATQAWNNVIRPMDDVVSQMGLSEADYPAAVWAPGNINGHRYSIPLDIHPMTMYYNEDLLKAAGLTAPPKTKEEFEKAAAAMTQGANKGFDITSGFPVSQIFQMLLTQFGGSVFNEKGTEVAFNSDAGVQALQWMKDAQSKYSAPKLAVDAELNAFKTGTVGMVWNGIWQISNVTGEGVEFAGKATAVPQIGTKMAVWAGSHQLTRPAHKAAADKCKDAGAAMFIRYVVDHSVEWAKGGQIPAANKVRSSPEFLAVHPQAEIAPSVENAFFPPAGVPGITDANGAPLDDAIGAIMSGTATDIKDTLDKAATRANGILTQNKGKYGDAPKAP
jgi:multiple sugar transport system substrate-binding protein